MLEIDGITISPSVASADPLRLEQAVRYAESRGCADIHIDVEDGNFIPNITFGRKTIQAIYNVTTLPLSFHLMTTDQLGWLDIAAGYRPAVVFGHIEQLRYPRAFTERAKQLGVRPGFALNPKQTLDALAPYIGDVEAVLLLSVEPDGSGELFIPSTYPKIQQLRAMSKTLEIWVDGNITLERLAQIKKAGATHAVLGRAFYQDPIPV